MNATDLREIFNSSCKQLKGYVEDSEIPFMVHALLESLTGATRTDIISGKPFLLTDDFSNNLDLLLDRLKNQEPVQYVTNTAWFMDLPFYVDSNVLIPRTETEELVHWILSDYPNQLLSVLDIGTGSGCIPVSLSRKREKWKVSACDIDEGALKVAERNSRDLGASVRFLLCDILNNLPEGQFDVLVSNPPYIPLSDGSEMSDRVKKYEPGQALFVPDEDPLRFYTRIISVSKNLLSPGGRIYFELHEHTGDKLVIPAREYGFEVTFKNDINGKLRMARLKRKVGSLE